ncbi:hypothetical protein DCS_07632 [Drechmeria coniospora]|uniref:Uncharacterized protein n=1 Tax=Drechmeria coniospora TaxID=98403 RepID=A0A151GF02_DRECN|nr:hypothetical protein DCS_07632 [Drechmeria coniospora]KYK55668.1 hypothetical protein DCS_07632 [Drechmeria coniospora]
MDPTRRSALARLPALRLVGQQRMALIVQPCIGLGFDIVAGTGVEDVMLKDEDAVVDHARVPEGKLDGVAGDAAPVALLPAIDALLGDAQDAAGEVEEDLPDAPAARAPVAGVGDDLGRVLDEGDEELDVAEGIDDVEGAPVGGGIDMARGGGGGADDEAGDGDAGDAAKEDTDDEAARPSADGRGEAPQGVGEERVLRDRDEGENGGVQGENDVVELNRRRQATVAGGVLFADDGGVVEGEVGGQGEEGDAAEEEELEEEEGVVEEDEVRTQDVDQRKVDGGAAGGTAVPVEQRLWVKAQAPAEGVDPAEEG